MSDELKFQVEILLIPFTNTQSNMIEIRNALLPFINRKLIEAHMDEHKESCECCGDPKCYRWQQLKLELEACK